MRRTLRIADRVVGDDCPAYIVAEIGINHNGDLDIAKKLIDAASQAGADAVKFQKRTPEVSVPEDQRDLPRFTPWGRMSYLEYRRRMEFGRDEYEEIDRYCRGKGLKWFASVWDEPAVEFFEALQPVCHKVPSACLTNDRLLACVSKAGRNVVLATGMSTIEEIRRAVLLVDRDKLVLAHTTSAYPSQPEELNLRMITSLRKEFSCPVGYSGHEVGLQTTYAAVVLGACYVERHLTLDRAMWGSDQAASVEPAGFTRLVRDIRVIERALGDGIKEVYASEYPALRRLRGNRQAG